MAIFYVALMMSVILISFSQVILKWRFMTHNHIDLLASPKLVVIATLAKDSWVLLAFMMVGIGALFWYMSMFRVPLSVMMPVASVVSPITVIASYFFLSESISISQIVGVTIIFIGVLLVAS